MFVNINDERDFEKYQFKEVLVQLYGDGNLYGGILKRTDSLEKVLLTEKISKEKIIETIDVQKMWVKTSK